MQNLNIREQNYSVFGRNTSITGEFKFFGPTFIHGSLYGEILVQDASLFTIDIDASVKGNIKCHDVEIFGKFEGILNSTGKVTIHPPATVSGEINTQNLVVYPGATVNADGHTLEKQ